MYISHLSRLLSASLLLLLIFAPVRAQAPSEEAANILAERIGDFRAQGAARRTLADYDQAVQEDYQIISLAARSYTSASNVKYDLSLVRTRSDSGAYALLTRALRQSGAQTQPVKLDVPDVLGFNLPGRVLFFKGSTFVVINGGEGSMDLARQLAGNIDGAPGEVPVLVKHLPEWESAQANASYAVSGRGLQEAVGTLPALDAVSFEGGAEAAMARYDSNARLVLIEHTTPQFAADSDRNVTQRIEQLKAAAQPVPSDYRRVGNYLVFVFDAPDQQTAARLIDGVKYEKDVRWLGENPHAFQRAERAYTRLTMGIVVATFKATGLALLVCLSVGGLFGGYVFMRRRRLSGNGTAYSDAGGMMRLNIDDINPQTNAKLIGPGEK